MSFLLVGHTHEDVDQCFSTISQKLKEKDALTMPNLEALIFNSQTPQPHVSKVNTVLNISGWLEPFINQVHNITFTKMYRLLSFFCIFSIQFTAVIFKRLTGVLNMFCKFFLRIQICAKIEINQQYRFNVQPANIV